MYICIEGNIGAGKTTVAISLAKRCSGVFLAEQFEDNPLLPLFYMNKKRMAFPLEYGFLISRHAQLNRHFSSVKKKITVADFCLRKCLWFAKANLDKKEFELYKKHFKIIESVAPVPDLLIYISTSSKNLLQNIKERGRDYEKNIDKKYLQDVSKRYEEGIHKMNAPVIEYAVGTYNPKTSQTIVNSIDGILKKGIKFKYKKINI